MEDINPFPFPDHQHETMNQNYSSKSSKLAKPPPSKEVCHVKKSNPKPTIPKKQWVQKPKKYFQIGYFVLVDKDLILIKIHGKVGVGYFYMAKFDGELLPSPVKGSCLTSFMLLDIHMLSMVR